MPQQGVSPLDHFWCCCFCANAICIAFLFKFYNLFVVYDIFHHTTPHPPQNSPSPQNPPTQKAGQGGHPLAGFGAELHFPYLKHPKKISPTTKLPITPKFLNSKKRVKGLKPLVLFGVHSPISLTNPHNQKNNSIRI